VGMIAGAVIAGVAAMLVALALFTTYRRRRSHSRLVYMGAKGATGRTSGSVTNCHAQKSQCSVHRAQSACISMLCGVQPELSYTQGYNVPVWVNAFACLLNACATRERKEKIWHRYDEKPGIIPSYLALTTCNTSTHMRSASLS